MTVQDIVAALNQWAPPIYQEGYDNAQLICGNPTQKILGVLASLDCTEVVIDEAIERGCNMVIAHHPIVFSGMKSLTGANYVERTVIKAIKHDIALYAIHTNLDNMWHGVNRKIADTLGLENVEILAPKTGLLSKLIVFVPHASADLLRKALFDAGAGHIGEYDHCSFNLKGEGTFRGGKDTNPTVGEVGKDHTEPETKVEVIVPAHRKSAVISAMMKAHPYEEVAYDLIPLENQHQRIGSGMVGTLPAPQEESDFLAALSRRFHVPVIKHTALKGKPVSRVALCGGSGSFLLPKAIARGADVFITSDFKYHEFFDADGKTVIMDIGHFESEQFTPHLIKEYLEEKFPTFAVLLSEARTNPVHYYIS